MLKGEAAALWQGLRERAQAGRNPWALVNLLCEETVVDSVNPLEMAPMGDIDLAEVKRARGA